MAAMTPAERITKTWRLWKRAGLKGKFPILKFTAKLARRYGDTELRNSKQVDYTTNQPRLHQSPDGAQSLVLLLFRQSGQQEVVPHLTVSDETDGDSSHLNSLPARGSLDDTEQVRRSRKCPAQFLTSTGGGRGSDPGLGCGRVSPPTGSRPFHVERGHRAMSTSA